jgi:hypothetical protein
VRKLGSILAWGLLVFATGCQSPLEKEVKALKGEEKLLQQQIEQTKSENEQLKTQVQYLFGLKPETRLENLYTLKGIKITGYTGFYDRNNDGKKESLIVYVQPIDQQGDAIKIGGTVDVQLWDLNNKESEALLAEWHIPPEELKTLWIGSLLTYNYRLVFDVAEKIEGIKDPLTVKVTFTDYLTGKVFTEQKVVTP